VDFTPEVSVGRIPYYGTIADLDSILQKIMDYENATGIGWRKNALLPMSFVTASYDGAQLAAQMRDDYLGAWGSCYRMYQQGGGPCPLLDSIYVSEQELTDPGLTDRIKNLATRSDLNTWEKEFLTSIGQYQLLKKRLSAGQYNAMRKIEENHSEEKTAKQKEFADIAQRKAEEERRAQEEKVRVQNGPVPVRCFVSSVIGLTLPRRSPVQFDGGPLAGLAFNLQTGSDRVSPLVHNGDSQVVRGNRLGIKTKPIIFDTQFHLTRLAFQLKVNLPGPRMFSDIVQGLLGNPVKHNFHIMR
jgi:hypothetical protein